MDAELRQVANGFDYKVRSFEKYDINGYRFRTFGKELSMADQKSKNCGVSAIGEGGTEYYGRVEAIYELLFYGANPPNVVVFKCYWFQPKETRRTHEHLGLVEIKQSTHLDVPDVYITAQQATQVFYLPWACQSDPNLKGWDVVYEVPPRVRPPPPNEEDYEPHINPDTYEGQFFQETRLSKKRFKNRSTSPLSRNKKRRKKKRLLLRMTCQCLTDYVQEAFHMLMHLLMMMMSTSLLIVMMMMHLLTPKHI